MEQKPSLERRGFRSRLEATDEGVFRGDAAVFFREDDPGTEFRLGPGIVERIMPTAFDRALKEGHDVRALFNHDESALLGRVSAGTLDLRKTKSGLEYTIRPPDTQLARDVRANLRAGNLSGSSFGFFVPRGGDSWQSRDDGTTVREIRDVVLVDVGPVTFPAYEATRAEAASSAERPLPASYHRYLVEKRLAEIEATL